MLRGGTGIARALVVVAAILVMCAFAVPGVALAGARVNMRIETSATTVWAGSTWVGNTHDIVDKDGAHHTTGVTALGALDDAARLGAFPYVVGDTAWGLSIESINGLAFDPNPPYPGWMYRVNGAMPPVGADAYALKAGDDVLFYYGVWDATPTAVRVSSRRPSLDSTLTVTALQLDINGNATPLPDARVYIGSSVATSNASGVVEMKMTRLGGHGVRIEKDGDYVRSGITSINVVRRSAIRFYAAAVGRGRTVLVRLRGRLVSGGSGLAGRSVRIQYKLRATARWRTLRYLVTNRHGYFAAWTRPLARTAWYRAYWPGDASHSRAFSAVRRVQVP